ncbi:MAG TPA: RtcB family protein [Ilumatobacteraceae bacterium]|nr:RtcB family protein [Ilumatobacteraceae bacterium]
MGTNQNDNTHINRFQGHSELVAPNLRNWATELDSNTVRQAAASARLPILAGPIALMPDAHLGYGVTVGSVIATEGAIVPSAVGVDIGCGMAAALTDLTARDLPDNLGPLLDRVARTVPAGMGQAHNESTVQAGRWFDEHGMPARFDHRQRVKSLRQFGTLGSGNHFAELSLDEDQRVWAVLHSGSRGIGNEIATTHIKSAAKDFSKVVNGYHLDDPDLAWLVQGTPAFEAYTADLLWLQDYALGNRAAMFATMTAELFKFVGRGRIMQTINCHHNYAVPENHLIDGVDTTVWITRKGAIRAFEGDLGIIPGSMGTDTFIVEGLGNEASWCSCSHGAGRRMSRTQAKRRLTPESLIGAMAGRTWLEGSAARLVDEHPDAYKDIEAVMADQTDLITVKHRLTAILNYKG